MLCDAAAAAMRGEGRWRGKKEKKGELERRRKKMRRDAV